MQVFYSLLIPELIKYTANFEKRGVFNSPYVENVQKRMKTTLCYISCIGYILMSKCDGYMKKTFDRKKDFNRIDTEGRNDYANGSEVHLF